MRNLILIFITSALISVSCSGVADSPPSGEQSIETAETGDKVLIRLKPKVGDEQKMMVNMKLEPDESDEMNVDMTSKVDMKVVNKEDSVFTYEMRYRSMKIKVQAGVMEMEYDSDSKEQGGMGSILGEQMKGLLENPVFMKMTEMGNVLEFKLPGNFSSEQTGDLGSVTIPLPKEAVGIGDSWTAERPLQGLGKMNMKMTVEKITVDFVQIKTNGVLTMDSEQKTTDFDGLYKLDRKTGFTKDGMMNMKTEVAGKMMNMKIEFKSF